MMRYPPPNFNNNPLCQNGFNRPQANQTPINQQMPAPQAQPNAHTYANLNQRNQNQRARVNQMIVKEDEAPNARLHATI